MGRLFQGSNLESRISVVTYATSKGGSLTKLRHSLTTFFGLKPLIPYGLRAYEPFSSVNENSGKISPCYWCRSRPVFPLGDRE